MKKFFAFLLTFAMLFSLAMPAMAAEGDSLSTIYFDVGQLENAASVQSVWLSTLSECNVNNKSMTHVSGTIYSYDISAAVAAGDTFVLFQTFSDEGETPLGNYYTTEFEAGKNLWTATGMDTGTWSVYGDDGSAGIPSAPSDDGNANDTSKDVTATYNPDPEAKWGIDADNLTEEGTLAEAIAAATATESTVGYIQLQSSVTIDAGYEIRSGVFTLDLNGNTLTSNCYNYALAVRTHAEVTLTDTATGGAVISTGDYAVYVVAGNVVINGGSYTSSGDYVVSADTTSSLTISGGTFTNGNWASVAANGTTTITGGTFTDGTLGHIAYWGGTMDLSEYDEKDLNGLTIYSGADLTVSEENIKLPTGYVFKDSKGNTVTTLAKGTVYTIAAEGTTEPTTPEAMWGTNADNLTEKGTLAEAIAAATATESTVGYIQLQSNVTTDSGYDIYSGVFTLDLNGKTLSNAGSYAIAVRDSAKVNLTGTATGSAVISTSGNSAVIATGGSKVVINGGSYSGSSAVFVATGSSVEINDGTFTSTGCYAVEIEASATIKGGSFSGPWASIAANGITTITGGSFTGDDSHGAIAYWSGTLDLSDYSAVNGLTLSQWTDNNLTVSDENIKLPKGYFFKDGDGNTVTALANRTIYTIGNESSVPTYNVIIADGISGGTVTVDKTTAAKGENVTVTVDAVAGYAYVVGSLTVTNDTTGEEVAVDEASKTFVMPDSSVTVTASFEKLVITSAEITWGSMSFTYDDTIDESTGKEKGWSNDGSEGAGTVTVTNTGDTAFTAQVAYTAVAEYSEITGTFDADSADLTADASKTFTLTLNGRPNKAILAGTKIGSVTITINEAQQGGTAKQDVTISLVDGAKLDYYYSDDKVDLATLVTNDAGLAMSYARTDGTGTGTITDSVLDFIVNGTHIIEVTTAETDTHNAGSFTFTITVTLDPGLSGGGGVVDPNPGIDLPIDTN